MTGFATIMIDMRGKRLALFKETVPRLSQAALLANPTYPFTSRYVEEYRAAASSLGLTVQEVQASKPVISSERLPQSRQVGLLS